MKTTTIIYSENNYTAEKQKEFFGNLTNIINETIIPKFGSHLTMNIESGLFTSDEYGSYRINFYKDEKKLCYIIADVIMGEWRGFQL